MAQLQSLVDDAIALVRTGERGDLRQRLEHTRRRLLDPDVRVIVVGEFKQGKSQLVNALVGAPVCPVDDDVATSVPTVVRHGPEPAAHVLEPRDGELVRRPIPVEDVAASVSEAGNPGNVKGLAAAEVQLPRSLLRGGLALVDSPGVGGLESPHALATLAALPTAHAVLLVSDASQEYTEPEMRFLRQAMRVCPNVACVVTKTDLYPDWREVADLDRRHLAAAGIDAPLFAVSSLLRLHALAENDAELNDESGFPDLIAYLRRDILGRAALLQRRSVAHDLASVAEHLRLALQSELTALEDPEATPRMVAELQAAKERADEQRRRTARWQVTLNDGMADLVADMEHDLRDRIRAIQREAENAIDAADPGEAWEPFAQWFEHRVAAAVSDTFVWTSERAEWLARHVAAHFSDDGIPLPRLAVGDTDGVLNPVPPVPVLDPGTVGPASKFLIGLRGSYGGVLMFGLLTGLAGMALINPISVGAGVLMGGKAYREDREARLKRRQAEAKTLVRRQAEDVVFQVGKQLRDRLRFVQRELRDHFTDIADEHHRSLAESVLAAQRAASAFASEREQRIARIKAELRGVDALRAKAAALEEAPATPRREPADRAAR